jgi:ATP-dependent RNA helicase DDX54/DBP10
MKLFIHRSGRTARAGQKGCSYGFLTTPEIPYIHDLSVFVGKKVISAIENVNEEEIKENPKYICFGKLP